MLGGESTPDEIFTVAIPGRGSSFFAGSLSAQVTRAELEALLLDGFFPDCMPTDRPRRALGAIKEFGLPYAFDGAITRHLAAFLRDRPSVDAVLFNGGSLHPPRLRDKLREQIGTWQKGRLPQVLESAQLELAVARGAAYSGRLLRGRAGRIEAGAARAVFLEAHRTAADSAGEAARPSLVCILPHGASAEQTFELADLDLRLRINALVRFKVYTSTRHEERKPGDVVELIPEEFLASPPLETVAALARPADGERTFTIPIALNAKVNELGLLQVSCRSLAPDILQSWPLSSTCARMSAILPRRPQCPHRRRGSKPMSRRTRSAAPGGGSAPRLRSLPAEARN